MARAGDPLPLCAHQLRLIRPAHRRFKTVSGAAALGCGLAPTPDAPPQADDITKPSTHQGALGCILTNDPPPPPGPPPGPGPGPGPSGNRRMSGGSIFLIVLFAGGGGVLVAGTLVNAKARGLRGREAVPLATVWTALPGLVKDGMSLSWHTTKRLITRGGGDGGYERV